MQRDGQVSNGMIFLYIDPLTEHIPTSKSLTIAPLQIPMPLRHRATSCDPAPVRLGRKRRKRLPVSQVTVFQVTISQVNPLPGHPPSGHRLPGQPSTSLPIPSETAPHTVQPSSSPGSTNVTLAFFLGLGPSGPPSSSSSSSPSSSST